MSPDTIYCLLLGLAILDALAATFAFMPGFGIPLGRELETLEIELPTNLAEVTDARTFVIASDLYGTSETFVKWQTRTRIAYACPWLWSLNGLGASPVTAWIEVEPETPSAGKTTFRSRRVARLWPFLILAGGVASSLRHGCMEGSALLSAFGGGAIVLVLLRPTARIAAGMYQEITAGIVRDHRVTEGNEVR